jgi:hypothetical protein
MYTPSVTNQTNINKYTLSIYFYTNTRAHISIPRNMVQLGQNIYEMFVKTLILSMLSATDGSVLILFRMDMRYRICFMGITVNSASAQNKSGWHQVANGVSWELFRSYRRGRNMTLNNLRLKCCTHAHPPTNTHRTFLFKHAEPEDTLHSYNCSHIARRTANSRSLTHFYLRQYSNGD